jgi:hypothetical protein
MRIMLHMLCQQRDLQRSGSSALPILALRSTHLHVS